MTVLCCLVGQKAAADALGPVDVLVSNAGLSRVQPPEDATAAAFDEMLAVNLRAPLLAQCAHRRVATAATRSAALCAGASRLGLLSVTGFPVSRRPRLTILDGGSYTTVGVFSCEGWIAAKRCAGRRL